MIDLQKHPLADKVIGWAREVHRQLSLGLLESLYESALCIEFVLSGLSLQRQVLLIGDFRLDLLVENAVVLELKSVDRLDAAFAAQLRSYLKLSSIKTGVLIDFHSRLLRDGIKRFVL